MKHVVFVTLSHTLTSEQIAELKSRFNDAEIILLSDVNPELAAMARQVDPECDIKTIQELAASIVAEACKVEATVFILQGEARLQVWANMYASGHAAWAHELFTQYCHFGFDGVHGSWYAFKHEAMQGYMKCLVSTSVRNSVDTVMRDGSIKKEAKFVHKKWSDMF